MILNKQPIILQNIRSLQKNFDLLNLLLETSKSKPIALSLRETWLKNHYETSQFLLKEYQKICSCERMKKGGGVGIFLLIDLDFVEVKKCDHNDLQALTIKIKEDKQLYLINTCIYIPPRTKKCGFSKVRKLLRQLTN